ncbi:MAG: hypothetical protein D6722_03655 [Bacteroidetes bacterium]|nr:MAG: hypothetical protein D6722_03655 [Bacteroidota bacterium]
MSVSIKDVVAITGAPGLHKVVKTDDQAIIVESLDAKARRQRVKGSMMVSKIMDISIYTQADSEPLVHVLQAIQEKYGAQLPVSKKSSNDELMEFLSSVLPDFDAERVYPSNVKKLVGWYQILVDQEVDLTLEEAEEESASEGKAEEAAEEEKEA